MAIASHPMRIAESWKEGYEYFGRVEWLKTVSLDEAMKEKVSFGNQKSESRPKARK